MTTGAEARRRRRAVLRGRAIPIAGWALAAWSLAGADRAAAQVAFPARPSLAPRPSPSGDASIHGASSATLYDEAAALLATRAPADLEASLRLFSRLTRREPRHARAHAGAATAASLLALYSVDPPAPLSLIARSAAAEAVRLDPSLAPAHAAMGLVSYLDAWDFEAAAASLRQALRLDESYADAWHWYGMLLLATSRFGESLAAFDRAVALEPGSSLFRSKRASVLAAAGHAEQAERELVLVIERAPQAQLARRELGYLLLASGREEEGVEALRRAAELSGSGERTSPDLAWAYARTGRRAEAEAILAELVARAGFDFVPPLDIALVHAGLGRRDEAFRWIESALEIRDPGLVYLATAPAFAPLRGDARYQHALARIGLSGARPEPAERVDR
jgi:tetratricopeptide (TPR) repeat protein